MRLKAFPLAWSLLALAAGSAHAISVESDQGRVLINRGAGFRTVVNSTQGAVGNRVLASAQSRARVVYDNGCVVVIEPGQTYTIAQTPPCAPGATGGEAAGGVAGVTAAEVATGAVVVGAGIGAIAYIANQSKSP